LPTTTAPPATTAPPTISNRLAAPLASTVPELRSAPLTIGDRFFQYQRGGLDACAELSEPRPATLVENKVDDHRVRRNALLAKSSPPQMRARLPKWS
jgi:hypothetical protein